MKKFYYDYADRTRNSLIEKIAQTEQNISREGIEKELKALYYRRYVNLVSLLNEKIREIDWKT